MDTYHELIRSLALTLVHSIWEGAVLVVLVLFILSVAGKKNSQLRYNVLLGGLMLLLTAFIVTFVIIYNRYPASIISLRASALAVAMPGQTGAVSAWPFEPGRLLQLFFQAVERLSPILALGWLIGFLFSGIKMAGGLYVSYSLLKREVFMPDQNLLALFERIRSDLLIPASVQLRLTSRRISPMVIGLLKPVVLVPLAALTGLNPGQVESLLLHELAHLRRFDHWAVMLQSVASQVLFFHPAAWYFSSGINHERENCCDDIVTKTCDPITYIKALTMIQEMNLSAPVPANALTGRSNRLLQRVKRLLKPEINHSPVFRFAVIMLLLMTLGIAAVTITTARATENNPVQSGNSESLVAGLASNPDTSTRTVMNGTVNKEITNKSGQTKKIKIIFEDDTVKMISVNGKAIPREEINAYEADIRAIREDVEGSNREMERASRELERAEEELSRAREEVMRARENLRNQQLAGIYEEVRRSMEGMRFEYDQLSRLHDGDVRKEMDRARIEANKAFEEMQRNLGEFKQQEWEQQLQHVFRQSHEQARKAFEEFFKNHGDSARFFKLPHPMPFHHEPGDVFLMPPHPPIPEFDRNVIPDLDEMIPELAEPSEEFDMVQPQDDEGSKGTLDSKLREVEEGNE